MKLKIYSNFRNAETDPLLVYIKSQYAKYSITLYHDILPTSIEQLKENDYNFLFLHEPNEFFGLHNMALSNNDLFTGILTWSDSILKQCDNGILFTYNGRTLDYDYINNLNYDLKKFEVSFLCGDKKLSEGHKLRHEIHKLENYISIPKKWYYVLDDYDYINKCRPLYNNYGKSLDHIPDGVDAIGYGRRILFNESMFNVVIENVNHLNWYNKIGDNFLTKTVPIYWGCPNISEFGYDERGIIRFENADDLLSKINKLTIDDYIKLKPFIDHNYEIAKNDEVKPKLSYIFNQFIELNKL